MHSKKDHGFDIVIYRLKQLLHNSKIQRVELGVEDYLFRRDDLALVSNDNASKEVFDVGKKELHVCKHQNTKIIATIIEHNPIRD